MTKYILALGAAAAAFSAMPAEARHYTNHTRCTRWHNHRCVAWHRMTRWQVHHRRQMMRRAAAYRVGYRFAPTYSYTEYSALPQPIVTRYHLRDNWRYVNDNGYVYVVNPTTYRVTRVISVP